MPDVRDNTVKGLSDRPEIWERIQTFLYPARIHALEGERGVQVLFRNSRFSVSWSFLNPIATQCLGNHPDHKHERDLRMKGVLFL